MSIGEAVGRYLQRTPEETYGREFFQKLDKVLPFGVQHRLLSDIERLVSGLIPPERTYSAAYPALPHLSPTERAKTLLSKFASDMQTNAPRPLVDEIFYELLGEWQKVYFAKRASGVDNDAAFEEAVKPLSSLIEAVRAGDITTNPFYARLHEHLTRSH